VNTTVRLGEHGDAAEIAWIPRDRPYGEKLATPDITIGDLIEWHIGTNMQHLMLDRSPWLTALSSRWPA
jgi:hypothetical protein